LDNHSKNATSPMGKQYKNYIETTPLSGISALNAGRNEGKSDQWWDLRRHKSEVVITIFLQREL